MNAGTYPLDKILARIEQFDETSDGSLMMRCPAHDDSKASLHVSINQDGTALLKCHAGCNASQIVNAWGLTLADLFPPKDDFESPKPIKPVMQRVKEAAPAKPAKKDYGEIQEVYSYHDADGNLVCQALRKIHKDGSKSFSQRKRDSEGGWVWNMKDIVPPLYRLPELLNSSPDERVFIVEGERMADYLAKWEFVATSSIGGAGKWKPHYSAALRDRDVYILPDNDEPGMKHAQQVIDESTGIAKTVTVVILPGLGPKEDIVDWIKAGHTREEFLEVVNSTPVGSLLPKTEVDADGFEDPFGPVSDGENDKTLATPGESGVSSAPTQPNDSEKPLSEPFPTWALPSHIGEYIERSAESIDVDPSQVAVPVLCSLAAAVGNARRLKVAGDWTVPPALFAAVVAESGSAKTPSQNAGTKFTSRHQADSWKLYREQMTEYEIEQAQYERNLAQWKKTKGGSEPPEAPEKPILKQFIVSDVTVEALAFDLQENPKGVLVARDELSGWFGSHDRYASKGSADQSAYLEMYSGKSFSVNRRTSGRLFVPSALVSITGTIQPGILQRVMGNQQRENGLLARFLFSYPERRVRGFPDVEVSQELDAAVSVIFHRLWELEFDTRFDGECRPVVIEMRSDARDLFKANTVRMRQEAHGLPTDLHAAYAKLEEIPARLGLIIHQVRVASNDPDVEDPFLVDASSVQAGIELANWFVNETKRVYLLLRSPASEETPEDKNRSALVSWIYARNRSTTVRDVQRSLQGRYPTSEKAETALNELVKLGWGGWCDVPSKEAGGRPTRVFKFTD